MEGKLLTFSKGSFPLLVINFGNFSQFSHTVDNLS